MLLVREGWLPFTNEVAEGYGIPTLALVRGNPTAAVLSGAFPEVESKAYLDELRRATLIATVAEHFLPGLAAAGIRNCRSACRGRSSGVLCQRASAWRPRTPAGRRARRTLHRTFRGPRAGVAATTRG